MICTGCLKKKGGHGRPESRLFLRKYFHYKCSLWSPERVGGRGLSIESRNFLRNICHFQSNLPFKSDFESHFTFKNFSLNSPEMDGGEGPSDQSPDFWWKDLRSRPSPDFTLWSPEIAKKGGE